MRLIGAAMDPAGAREVMEDIVAGCADAAWLATLDGRLSTAAHAIADSLRISLALREIPTALADLSKRAGKPDARPSDMPPPVRNELRAHARRSAQLDRIEAIAKEKDNDKLVDRVKELRKKEDERHEARLEKLIENWKGKP